MTPKARIWRSIEDFEKTLAFQFLGWLLFTGSAVTVGIIAGEYVYAWMAG